MLYKRLLITSISSYFLIFLFKWRLWVIHLSPVWCTQGRDCSFERAHRCCLWGLSFTGWRAKAVQFMKHKADRTGLISSCICGSAASLRQAMFDKLDALKDLHSKAGKAALSWQSPVVGVLASGWEDSSLSSELWTIPWYFPLEVLVEVPLTLQRRDSWGTKRGSNLPMMALPRLGFLRLPPLYSHKLIIMQTIGSLLQAIVLDLFSFPAKACGGCHDFDWCPDICQD